MPSVTRLFALTGAVAVALLTAVMPQFAHSAENSSDSVVPQTHDARMQWWRDARFGLFIHWGVYSVPAGSWNGKYTDHNAEWIMHRGNIDIPVDRYEQLTQRFNPVNFDADRWAKLADEAGMKYMVMTSKHHDGFAMYDSNFSTYDIVDATPYDTDVLKEMTRAFREEGVAVGFYYSIMDWHHYDYQPRRGDRSTEGADYDRYVTYMHRQLRELMDRFDPAILWFDGDWEDTWTMEHADKTETMIHNRKPAMLINNRLWKRKKGYGDFGTPEKHIPATGLDHDWETCMTMNDTWGYSSHDYNWKSSRTLIRQLIDTASKGGNYLLNIGPKADGTIPRASIERLKDIGKWMDQYSEAIYGTEASPLPRPRWGRITAKSNGQDNTLYLHVFRWPEGGQLPVNVSNKVKRCYALDEPSRTFEVDKAERGKVVQLTGSAPNQHASVIALELAGSPKPSMAGIPQQDDGSIQLAAADANLHNSLHTPTMRRKWDGREATIENWKSPKTWIDWRINVDQPGRFRIVAAVESPTSPTKVKLSAGDQAVTDTIPAKSAGEWIEHTLGEVAINATGEATIELRGVKGQFKQLKLRHLTLEPMN
jgi:alpha-L-fucosidase